MPSRRLGEPLYRKIEPTGYSSANAEWISSAGLLDRMNFAFALAHNKLPGVKVDVDLWKAACGRRSDESRSRFADARSFYSDARGH